MTERSGPQSFSIQSYVYRPDGNKDPGNVLVVVNHEFEYESELERGNDVQNIERLFSKYGYHVHYGYNLNKEEILNKVHEIASKSNSATLICFISSHGDQTSLCCPDGNNVQIIDILKQADTEELKECPKVFFFDACRSQNGSLDGKGLPEPPTSNYYVGFSCLDTKTSMVGRESCGVYFDEIVKTFEDGFPRDIDDIGKLRDLNHFMNKVHYTVNTKYQQVPTIRTTLVGKVFLQKPKWNEYARQHNSYYAFGRDLSSETGGDDEET